MTFNRSLLLFGLILSLLGGDALAEEFSKCDSSYPKKGIKTPLGYLQHYTCPNTPPPSRSWQIKWVLENKLILNNSQEIVLESGNKNNSLLIFKDWQDPTTFCAKREFLLDTTGQKPRLYAFGVTNACAEYHWASWGKKRSVIALKRNVEFTFNDGKFIAPDDEFGGGSPYLNDRLSEGVTATHQPEWKPFVVEIPIK